MLAGMALASAADGRSATAQGARSLLASRAQT